MAVYRDNEVVGHVPYNQTPRLSVFLRRDVNKYLQKLLEKSAGELGNGLKILRVCLLYGPKVYVDRVVELVNLGLH